MVECVKCQRRRGKQFMIEAVFPVPPHEGAGVYRCASTESCKQARKKCNKCNHRLSNHDLIENWFGGRKNVVVCTYNMGMGDPCGCEAQDPNYNDYANGHTYDRT